MGGCYEQGTWPRVTTREPEFLNAYRVTRKYADATAVPARVLYALEFFPQLSETYVTTEIACMRRRGVHVEAWSEFDAVVPYETDVLVHRGSLEEAIRRSRPDVVHTHHLHRALKYLPAATAAGLPMTVRGHGAEFTEERLRALEEAPGIAVVYQFPHLIPPAGLGSDRVRTMTSCFDPELYFPAGEKDRRMVVRTGLASPPKDMKTFLRVAARCPRHRFVLIPCFSIGFPQHLDEILEYNRSLGSPVEILPNLPHRETADLVRRAAIHLHTHALTEPFGMPVSIAEAMAAGCYLIGRRCAAVEAYLGEAGRTYESEDEAVTLVTETLHWDEERWRRAYLVSLDRAYAHFLGPKVLAPLLEDWSRLAGRRDSEARPPFATAERFGQWCGAEDGRKRFWSAGAGGADGLEPVDFYDSRLEPAETEAGPCLSALNPNGSAQAYFRIAGPHGLLERPVRIAVEVLADADDEVWVEYDSTDRSVRVVPRVPGAFKRAALCRISRSGRWETCVFEIADGRFCRGVSGADFRVVCARPPGERLCLRRVVLAPQPQPSSRESEWPMAASERRIRLAFPEQPDPEVTIVIPVWNRLELTLQCLSALRAHTAGAYEVVVVDNGSSDGTAGAMRSIPGLRLVAHDSNLGFARACNAGAAASRASRLLFLNNDTVPQPGWLAAMLGAMARDSRIGIVGSRLLYPETGEVQHAGVAFSVDGNHHHRFQLCRPDTPGLNVDCFVPAVTGACLLTTRELFERYGGFDESFRNGYEDLDFCLRAREADYRVLYCASSILLHHESATARQLSAEADKQNRTLFLERWGERIRSFPGEGSEASAEAACAGAPM